MTKADKMRKMAAQNKKTKTEKVDDYEETLNKTYAKFICTVEDSANKGISKGYAAEIPTERHAAVEIMSIHYI